MAYPGMADDFKGFSPNAHLLVGEMPAPTQLKRSWWQSTGVSIVTHSVILGALIYAATHVQPAVCRWTCGSEAHRLLRSRTPGPPSTLQ